MYQQYVDDTHCITHYTLHSTTTNKNCKTLIVNRGTVTMYVPTVPCNMSMIHNALYYSTQYKLHCITPNTVPPTTKTDCKVLIVNKGVTLQADLPHLAVTMVLFILLNGRKDFSVLYKHK